MSETVILIFIFSYFALVLLISYLTSRKSNSETFFTGNHQSPWYIVAYGLIGTSLSGVTFNSVTGKVLVANFSYLQMVLGFVAGYFVIAFVLLPLYYRLNLTSIYTYLGIRYGDSSRKIGSFYFILSRLLGAAARLYMVALILGTLVFEKMNISFELTVAITLAFIFIYTFQSGIKTIIWTDTIQTTLLLAAIAAAIYSLMDLLGKDFGSIMREASEAGYTTVFSGGTSGFLKSFGAGVFICVTMTGLDQGMMQRSLSCKNLRDAQKNIISFSFVLLLVNLCFLFIGAMLALYVTKEGMTFEKTDLMFGVIATTKFATIAMGLFMMGMIAATFSSADDAMAALTTSFCIDIIKMDETKPGAGSKRKLIHLGFAVLLFLVIVIGFKGSDDAVIDTVYLLASYTYGPLLGLYAFGLFTRRDVKDIFVPAIAIVVPIIILCIAAWEGYHKYQEQFIAGKAKYMDISIASIQDWISKGLGAEVIFYNGALCFVALFLLSRPRNTEIKPDGDLQIA
jgi:Na+/proline symporter